jgi:hypothetical protein
VGSAFQAAAGLLPGVDADWKVGGSAGEEPLILTAHGKPVAVLLPLENTDLETA